MKILGIGVDIVENKRLKNSIKNKSFISRLFTLLEIKNSRFTNNFFIEQIFFASKSLMCLLSSRRCIVIESAPFFLTNNAALYGSG